MATFEMVEAEAKRLGVLRSSHCIARDRSEGDRDPLGLVVDDEITAHIPGERSYTVTPDVAMLLLACLAHVEPVDLGRCPACVERGGGWEWCQRWHASGLVRLASDGSRRMSDARREAEASELYLREHGWQSTRIVDELDGVGIHASRSCPTCARAPMVECESCKGRGRHVEIKRPKVYDAPSMDFIEENVAWHRERWDVVEVENTFGKHGAILTQTLTCSRRCQDCHGSGKVPETVECRMCEGSGYDPPEYWNGLGDHPCPYCTDGRVPVPAQPTGRHQISLVEAALLMAEHFGNVGYAMKAIQGKTIARDEGDTDARDALAVLADELQARGDRLGVLILAGLRGVLDKVAWTTDLRASGGGGR